MSPRIPYVLASLALAAAPVAPLSAQASASANLPPYTAADAQFMTNMIHHHAQAVMIAGWAESHGASPSLQALCARIVVGQQDEIALMERWLRARGEPIPDAAAHVHMSHEGMPGMLNAEQLAALNAARGPAFDHLFITDMIQHHLGAIMMVNQLFATPGAGQDETTFRLASDIYADQTTEVARMEKMLAALDGAPTGS